ncbi:MAG: ribosomal protein S18-alanine N-acetyltransferase [Candidatus Nanopelagicales bacterium]|nr:ribosomal protein S18-alanine N-acetyltransferase [Candidatus Nanopelagicales bacterium]
MTHSDLARVLEIEVDLFPVDAWSEDLFLGELAEVSISRDVSVAILDSEIVGYASFRYVGKQGDVNTVAVASNQQGKGIGTALMDWLESQAALRNVQEIFLEVRSDNEAAIKMYDARGYERIDIRRNYYGNTIDANIMRKRVANV